MRSFSTNFPAIFGGSCHILADYQDIAIKISPERFGKKTQRHLDLQMNVRLLHVLEFATRSIRVANSFG